MKKVAVTFLFCLTLLGISAQQRTFFLYTKMNGKALLSYGDSTWIWGYGFYDHSVEQPMTLPAPLLTVYTGDTVSIDFTNLSGEQHTIHLHGTDVDMLNDGSPHTSPAVLPNASTVYNWNVAFPGSYFYHCHVMTVHHLQMGMYGMMIAQNATDTLKLYNGGPGFSQRYTYLFSDMDTSWNNNPLSPGHLHEFHPSYFMINGYSDWMMFNRPNQIINAPAGDSICLHLGNIGFTTVRLSFPQGCNATVYQSDARVLPSPFVTDTLRIYPGERYEVIIRPSSSISGWIEADYLNAILDDSLYTNYIGINQYSHPSSIATTPGSYSSELKPYPNPASRYFMVNAESPMPYELYTVDGKSLGSGILRSGVNHIECPQQHEGMMFMKTSDAVYRIIVIRD